MIRTFEMHGPLSAAPPAYRGTCRLGTALERALAQANGAAAYGGALVLLPSGACEACPTMEAVNAGSWKEAYPRAVRETWFFAVDVHGHPFGIHADAIRKLDPETGKLRRVAATLGTFLAAVEADPDATVGLDYLDEWFSLGRSLDIRERLVPVFPVLLGGGRTAADHRAADLMESLDYQAYLYRQTKDLPDGSRVLFKVVD